MDDGGKRLENIKWKKKRLRIREESIDEEQDEELEDEDDEQGGRI